MFKIRPIILFVANILLMAVSWMCYKFPQGDEYLFLFMIPLVFIAAPFVMTLPMISIMLFVNVLFFLFYALTGVLNPIDVGVLVLLLVLTSFASYLIKYLYMAFLAYHRTDILGKQKEYNSVVNDLESVDRRGRKIESELSRISRLYEITKRLAPALTFEDLLKALFDFLEDNFRFDAMHLVAFKKGNFSQGVSKSSGNTDYYENKDMILEYEKVLDCVKEREYKPFFETLDGDEDLFKSLKVRSDSFMAFPLYVGDKICAILAIEGASRGSYGRFRILVSQIALEFRKVELYEEVQELSIIDGLTEVFLRRYLMDRLEEEVDRAGRLGLTFSIAMADVDHFKECNDEHGHLVGDAVLRQIAERLKASVREVDMIARYGGEEFCIVLPETSKELAMTVSERIRKSIEVKSIRAFDEEIRITVSLGVATYPEDGKDVETLIEKADTALYKAKRKGRNKVCPA
ncbi:MAG: GGDEF domain-containing protein [Candidatus Tantalella remota]|nr:GGDEF domain-containing protein [Candidatus Tantalella remota]